jgi:histidine triad (HIT) family protein
MTDCIFCKIINKESESDIVFENDNVIAFKDIKPKAKIHILIVPKKHINSIKEIKEEDKSLMGELLLVAQKIGEQSNAENYKLVFNVGRGAGQIVDHIHMHLLSE